jgi:photosystem II stability/assembly factor-like uncharacterized protein
MRTRGKAAASWRALASTLLWATMAIAKSDNPTVKVTSFKDQPLALNYFRGSDDVLFHDRADSAIWRSDDGGASWAKVGDIPDKTAYSLIMHEFNADRAYVLTASHTHYQTKDRGKSWTKFDTELEPSAFRDDILKFNAADPDRIIFNGMKCLAILCSEEAAYTLDSFKTNEILRGNTAGCWWAKSSKEFATGQAEFDKQRVLCIARDPFSPFSSDQRLMISDNFFVVKDNLYTEFEPDMDTTKGVAGVVNVAAVKKYLLVATTSMMSNEMALFVTDDTVRWHRAMFPTNHGHTIQEAYTVLESTDYSIQIDVMTTRPSNPTGVLFTSNSNGTYFTENLEYTNRNERGLVDFESVTGIQGIFLVNQVENGEEVSKNKAEKKIISRISFDDGRTFSNLKTTDGDKLHLHSVTQLDNIGRVFSSPAPGLLMGNGNTGDHLKKMSDAWLYVSDDAGVTWAKALEGPHKYKFGDEGSILVAVKDSEKADVSEFSYSIDHGKNWKQVSLPDGLKIVPLFITTSEDASTLKFILVGMAGDESIKLIGVDFDGLHERTCGDGDMEDFHARVDKDGKSTCLMGHKQTFRRRKKTAECFIKKTFEKVEPKTDDCDCTDADFECDYNFERDGDECVKKGKLVDTEGSCKGKDGDAHFKGSSGWRRIPGNTCKRSGGKQKDDLVDRKCSESTTPSSTPHNGGNLDHKGFHFDTDLTDLEKVYLEKGESNQQTDETVIVRPVTYRGDMMETENKLWRTTDHGKNWDRILEDETIRGIYPHPYFTEAVFFTTKDSKKVMYTMDRGRTFHHFDGPGHPVDDAPFGFHPDRQDWIIFFHKDQDDGTRVASVSKDRGDHWTTLDRDVVNCEFTGSSAYLDRRSAKQIICLAHKEGSGDASSKHLVVINNFFEDEKATPVIKDGQGREVNVKQFATMSEFIVIAAEVKGEDGLLAFTTMDGETFAEAKFPVNWKTKTNSEYTVLDSSTHAINLFVATEIKEGKRYGNIIKSNSNGTEYVLSALGVNCNDQFYVDFEKIPGLEGVILVNTVANRDNMGNEKKMQTKITHDDGAQWLYLPPPAKDKDGKAMPCKSSRGDDRCALHLHGYTERDDKKKTFSAATAVGLMFGVGNVGPHLGKMEDADTYMTTDAGVTWKQVQKGIWTWQFGDRGSIAVLVKQWKRGIHEEKTNSILYSTNEGDTWDEYKFSDEEVQVLDITSLRSGLSRNFILWCKTSRGMEAINVDFTGLATEACKEDDYTTWTPEHPEGGNGCLFGHKRKYLRKKKTVKCYNAEQIKLSFDVENCPCTRQDFEWYAEASPKPPFFPMSQQCCGSSYAQANTAISTVPTTSSSTTPSNASSSRARHL